MSATERSAVTLMAFDFGARRIGVAVGNALINTTNPLTTVRNQSDGINWSEIDQLIKEWQPDLIIVGLPLMLDGKPSSNTPAVEAFAAQVTERSQIDVVLVDEKLSSTEAREHLRASRRDGLRKRTQAGDIDKFAAEVILRTWLNQQGSGTHADPAH